MKKILALALVLVLAIGMMVPAMAATKAKITDLDTLIGNPTQNEGDIHPGYIVTVPFTLGQFLVNQEALDAIAGAKDVTSLKAVVKRLIETAEPRYRARAGGQIFEDPDISDITEPTASITITETDLLAVLGWAGGSFNSAVSTDPFYGAMSSKSKFNTAVDKSAFASADKTAAKKAFSDLYDAKELTYLSANIGLWSFNVELETVDPWASVNDVDFEVDLYFLLDGKRTDPDFYVTVIGNFSNDVTPVYSDTYDVDSYKGQVIEAEEYVSKIAICGNYEYDINANVKMAKDKKIYFYVTTEADISDEGIFDKYPAIEVAFKVLQVGLNSYTGNFISLDGVDSTYYVYGKDANGTLKYLGRGGELLPLSSKYYIATTKLDLAEDAPIDEDLPTDPVPEDNFNPSTGI